MRRAADTLAAGIAGARRVALPGAGHLINIWAPDAFDRAILSFLR